MAASTENLANEMVLARHPASFMEKIAELQERQGKGSKFLKIEGQEMQIQRLVALEERQAYCTPEPLPLLDVQTCSNTYTAQARIIGFYSLRGRTLL